MLALQARWRSLVTLVGFTALMLWAATVRATPPTNSGGELNSGDTAWVLAATALVLLMTPGLSLFVRS
jgi:Amt family ammonium transporter